MFKQKRFWAALLCVTMLAATLVGCDGLVEGNPALGTQAETEIETEETFTSTEEETLWDTYTDGSTTIVFESNHDGTCRVVGVIDSSNERIDLVIPSTSPKGEKVVSIERIYEKQTIVPKVLLPEDFEVIRNKVLAFYKNNENDFYFRQFLAYFKYCSLDHIDYLASLGSIKSEDVGKYKEDLLQTYPETAVCDIYVLDEGATRVETERLDDVIKKAYPEYTEIQRQRDLDNLLSVCRKASITNSYASQFSLHYNVISPERLTSITIPNTVTNIDAGFGSCSALTDVYFTGTEEEWKAISKSDAEIPSTATIHYNYQP